VVNLFEQIAAEAGAPLRSGMRLLDFGAGAGRHVAEFREAGYDALGIDQIFSSHEIGSVEEEYLHRVEPPDYELPFEEACFDFVYSTTVMEHVLDPGSALREIARVLRPGGLSVHVFPARWRPIESHMSVPLGGVLQSYLLMRLWAALGIRNTHQGNMTPTELALSNVQFCRSGVSYPSAHEWELRAQHLFRRVRWDEATFVRALAPLSRASRLAAPWMSIPGVPSLYRTFHMRVLVLHR